MPPLDQMQIGPLHVANYSQAAAIQFVLDTLGRRDRLALAFANAHTVVTAVRDPAVAKALEDFTVFNDGIGVELAAKRLYGRSFADNLNGTDFTPALLAAAPPGTRLFLLGGRPGISAQAAAAILQAHPHLLIAGERHGYVSPEEEPDLAAQINQAQPDILLVAMGNPKQELLIHQLKPQLEAPIAIGVGALFDFLADAVPRAPKWMRDIKLEWVFRLAQEPRRLAHRYTIGIGHFFWVIEQQRREANSNTGQKR